MPFKSQCFSQNIVVNLNHNWQFRQAGTTRWHKANVPGTVHTDLQNNKLIPDPFFRDNESRLQWIDSADWEYRLSFAVDERTLSQRYIELHFDGLDTYADIYLNNVLLLKADNMFRGWTADVKKIIKSKGNLLFIRFFSAQRKVDSIAKSRLPLILPDNSRVYARKAQFQFGWDWGPKFIGCGIWKMISLHGFNRLITTENKTPVSPFAKLIQQRDTIGTSFYFAKEGKPVYIKGANWIPADIFLPRLKSSDYRLLLQRAKDANMNMLRVWGGGVYEADEFYDTCDELGIMVWQDLMFAGGMYPGDDAFFANVKEEIKYQVNRLKHHPCIVLWCGNNEVDEAWHNWGWQGQFNLHGADSIKVWNDYTRLFRDSLRRWINEYDGRREYISTSPKNGWGHKESFTEADSHYWGLWWGLEDWEAFETKTGRFVSEYGMQSMPNMATVKSYTSPDDRNVNSPIIAFHQKASEGFRKLNHYVDRYFFDTTKLNRLSLDEYVYLTQCLQYYILKNSIAVHRGKYPANMGTLLWQLNDCWPVTSWSITDYSRQPKAAWYAVKEAYRDHILPQRDTAYPKDLRLSKPSFTIRLSDKNHITVRSNVAAKYVYLSQNEKPVLFAENYFDLRAGEVKTIAISNGSFTAADAGRITITSLYDILNKQ